MSHLTLPPITLTTFDHTPTKKERKNGVIAPMSWIGLEFVFDKKDRHIFEDAEACSDAIGAFTNMFCNERMPFIFKLEGDASDKLFGKLYYKIAIAIGQAFDLIDLCEAAIKRFAELCGVEMGDTKSLHAELDNTIEQINMLIALTELGK